MIVLLEVSEKPSWHHKVSHILLLPPSRVPKWRGSREPARTRRCSRSPRARASPRGSAGRARRSRRLPGRGWRPRGACQCARPCTGADSTYHISLEGGRQRCKTVLSSCTTAVLNTSHTLGLLVYTLLPPPSIALFCGGKRGLAGRTPQACRGCAYRAPAGPPTDHGRSARDTCSAWARKG